MRSRKLMVAMVVIAATAGRAAADDGAGSGSSSIPTLAAPLDLHIASPSHITTDGGSEARLPSGWFLDDATYQKLDAETKRLQNAETRLTAENASLQKAVDTWQPGWITLASALLGGLVLGYEIEKHY